MKKGFTLIEVIIYIALFSLLIGTAFVTAYQLIEGSDKLNVKRVNQEEINFVLRKIDWALTGVQTIDTTSFTNGYSDTLTLTKYDGNQIDIQKNGAKIEMKESAGPSVFTPITTDNVKVTSLQFHYISTGGSGPSGITATTTINGFVATTTKYIRN